MSLFYRYRVSLSPSSSGLGSCALVDRPRIPAFLFFLEPVAFTLYVERGAVVEETIEYCRCEDPIVEDLPPVDEIVCDFSR